MKLFIFLVVVVLMVTIYNVYNAKRDIRRFEDRMDILLRWYKISNDGVWKKFEFEMGKLGINHIKDVIKRHLDCFYPLLIDSITEVEFEGRKYVRIIYKDDDDDTIKDVIEGMFFFKV